MKSLTILFYHVTIQMKALERYFLVVLFMPYNVVPTFETVEEILTIQVKAIGHYFPMGLFKGA